MWKLFSCKIALTAMTMGLCPYKAPTDRLYNDNMENDTQLNLLLPHRSHPTKSCTFLTFFSGMMGSSARRLTSLMSSPDSLLVWEARLAYTGLGVPSVDSRRLQLGS